MKKNLISILLLLFISYALILGSDIQATTTNNGLVRLNQDGTWEWLSQPTEFLGFNDPDTELDPASEIETIPFDFKDFSSFPVNYIGKWSWLLGEVFMIMDDERGKIIRIKTRKNLESWIKDYGDVLIINYDGPKLNEGDKIEILVQYKGVGYKYYSTTPVFFYKNETKVKFLE